MPHESIAPTPDEIAVGAYHLWEKESRPLGRQNENWIEAETQLMLFDQKLEVNLPIRQNGVSPRNNYGVPIQTASAIPCSGKTNKTRQPRILVVDDDPFATHMLGALLRKHAYVRRRVKRSHEGCPNGL